MSPRPADTLELVVHRKDVSESSRLGMYLSGFFLLAIARGIWRRKRAAWWLAAVLLSLTTLLQFARGPDLHHIILALAIFDLLIWRRRDYVAASDRPSIRWALIFGLPILSASSFMALWASFD
jgi:lysylphosphatidylglycerol synthetase-like protein (DUF2156 family)